MDDFLTEKQIERINRIRAERATKKVMGSEPPTTRFGEPIKSSAAKKDEILLTALKEWYEAQDNDFEAFHKQNKKGEIVEIKEAFKALTDDLAKKYGLPKTWLKEAMGITEKYNFRYP